MSILLKSTNMESPLSWLTTPSTLRYWSLCSILKRDTSTLPESTTIFDGWMSQRLSFNMKLPLPNLTSVRKSSPWRDKRVSAVMLPL